MKNKLLKKYVCFVLLIGMCCTLSACSKKTDPSQEVSSDSRKPLLYTVNYPLAYFAKRIGGDQVEVKFPGPVDEDPAYWQPDAAAIEGYQNANLILTNGAGYAKWIDRISLPTSKCINTSSAFQNQYIELDEVMTHSHGPEGEHAHGDWAFTTWLDFELAAMHANTIKEALIQLTPDNKLTFEANYLALEKDLFDLDQGMKAVAEKIEDTPLIVSHPVYQYWSRAYGLNTKSVHWEPDELPNQEQWKAFQEMLKLHPTKWMLWEGEPISQTVENLNDMQIQSVIFNPCGAGPSIEDFLRSMQVNIENLKQIQ